MYISYHLPGTYNSFYEAVAKFQSCDCKLIKQPYSGLFRVIADARATTYRSGSDIIQDGSCFTKRSDQST